MTTTTSVFRRSTGSAGLYEVIDLILDKGLVIDAFIRVSVLGLEVLTIDVRIVVASVDTYLRFAEAVDRLDLHKQGKDISELAETTTRGVSRGKVGGAVEGATEKVGETVGGLTDRVKETVGGGDDEP